MASIAVVSKEFLYITGIQAFNAKSPDAAVDPTTLSVQIAATARGMDPVESDWHDAEWHDPTTARILVGPAADLSLPIGWYAVWLRVIGAVEQPEQKIGELYVT